MAMTDDEERPDMLADYQQKVEEYLRAGGEVTVCPPCLFTETLAYQPSWPQARRGKAQNETHKRRRADIKEENIQKVLAALDPKKTQPEMALAAGVHPRSIGQYMQELRARGLTEEWDAARGERRKIGNRRTR